MFWLKIQLKKSDGKNINEIGNILQQIQSNLKSMKFYKDSFCQGFFNNLYNQILRSDQYKGKDYIIRLKNSFKYFDSFFKLDIKQSKSIKYTELEKKKNELIENLDSIFKKYNFESIFSKTEFKITNFINENIQNASDILKQNNDDLDKTFTNITQVGIKTIIEEFQKEFDMEFDSFNNEVSLCKNEINNVILDLIDVKKKNDISKSNIKELFIIRNLKDSLLENLGIEKNLSIKESISFLIFGAFCFNYIGYLAFGITFFIGLLGIFILSKEEKLKIYLKQFKNEFIERFNQKKRNFIFKLYEEEGQIKNAYKMIIALAFTNLCEIEEKEWEQAKQQYLIAKNLLKINDEKDEILNEIEKKKRR